MLWLLALLSKLPLLAGHITVRNSFPKPLNKTEEKALIERYTATGDPEAREKLIAHNLRLVAHIAKKYNNGKDGDDLISIGSIGLIKAIATFRPEKAAHLATYASRCIENEILMYLRATKRQKCEVSLQEPIGTDKEGNEVTLIDVISGDDDVDCKAEKSIRFSGAVSAMQRCLDRREQKVLLLRYGLSGKEPLAQREVAKQLGISRSYVSRIEKSAMEKLKKELR